MTNSQKSSQQEKRRKKLKTRQKAKRKTAKKQNEKPPKSQMKSRQKAKRCFKSILFDAKLNHERILSSNYRCTIEEEFKTSGVVLLKGPR